MLKSKFLKNNFYLMSGTLIGGFLGYLFHFFVSRQISVAQYGELQSLVSISIIFGVFNSALSYFVIKHTSVFAAHNDFAANRKFIDYLAPRISRFTLLILLVLCVASPLLAHFLHFSSTVGFVAISLTTFFSTMSIIYSEVLRGWQSFFLLGVIGIAGAFAKLLSGIVLTISSHTAGAASLSLLAAALITFYITKYFGKRILARKDPSDNVDWREKYFSETSIRRSALNIFVFSLALVLASNLDVLLVKYFASAQIAGYFGAFNLLGKIVLLLNMTVVGVILPDACAEGYLSKRLSRKNLLRAYGLMTLIGLGLTLAYYIAPNLIINLFFGNKYIFDTQILWLFGLLSFLLSILTLEANLSFAKHDFRVIYLLTATVLMMIAGLAKYHANLQEIALVFTTSFFLGYVLVFILNLSHELRRVRTTQ